MFDPASRTPNSLISQKAEELRIVSESGDIPWKILKLEQERHGAWCVPLVSWETYDESDVRFLSFIDDGVTKIYYDPEKYWVVAGHPDGRPKYGRPIVAQPANRSKLGSFKGGDDLPPDGVQARLQALKKWKDGSDKTDLKYPGKGDLVVGPVHQIASGGVNIHHPNEDAPLAQMTSTNTKINSGSTTLGHEPQGLSFQNHQVGTLTTELPSTVTIPVQTFIPINPDLIMIMAIVAGASRYFNESSKYKHRNRDRQYVTTEYIEYNDLLSKAEAE